MDDKNKEMSDLINNGIDLIAKDFIVYSKKYQIDVRDILLNFFVYSTAAIMESQIAKENHECYLEYFTTSVREALKQIEQKNRDKSSDQNNI